MTIQKGLTNYIKLGVYALGFPANPTSTPTSTTDGKIIIVAYDDFMVGLTAKSVGLKISEMPTSTAESVAKD